MAEDDSRAAQGTATDDRPQTAYKDHHDHEDHEDRSRKDPGGFGLDDQEDDLSPEKDSLDSPGGPGSSSHLSSDVLVRNDLLPPHTDTDALEDAATPDAPVYQQSNPTPSLDHANLPVLPPPGDSSVLYNQSGHAGSDALLDGVDETAMQRHLNDVESSFMPVPSPIALDGKQGVDDTFLFDGAQGSQEARSKSPASPVSPTSTLPIIIAESPRSPPTPPNAYQTPAARASDDSSWVELEKASSSLETMSSSPTAAAAARTVSRAISMASAGEFEQPEDSDDSQHEAQEASENYEDHEATPRKRRDGSSDQRHRIRHSLSNRSLNAATNDAGSTPGHSLLSSTSSGRQPKYLRSRHSSHNSSVSSLVTNPESAEGSDATLGADYALQSGGSAPDGFNRGSERLGLSRSISLGSMASGIDDYPGSTISPARGSDSNLATLQEEQNPLDGPGISPPETPKPVNRSLAAAPTDTIIARHVRNVQVPDAVAQAYRNKTGEASNTKKPGFPLSTLGRNGKNLTLKEQSSTIERLSKENFDLKLKVMFLSDRLDKLSEEGVKEMISENVELKTALATIQRDNKALKRKVKDLEKQLKDDEERPSTANSGTSGGNPSPKWFDHEAVQEQEEELFYLRERVEEYVTEIEQLRSDAVNRENEKRSLAEMVRQMGERRGQTVGAREEMDVWKDLLEQETSRREQADEDVKRLREENFRLKNETTSSVTGIPGLNHTTNIYNITKKRQMSPSRPRSGLSNETDDRAASATTTLVEDLRRDAEQLRHENAELRREVGAQTSMLTSRNREKERLYQEIEDLKLGQRRGAGSVAGDSILDRSASRAHVRSQSRGSAVTRVTEVTEAEREEFENKQSDLRDKINSLKIQNQDLQRELESCMEDFEVAVVERKKMNEVAAELQQALETAEEDIITIQNERDDALQGQEEAEAMFEGLRKEAQEELDGFAVETEEANAEIERLSNELADTTENFNALQNEMREMSESVIRLEDDHQTKSKRIQELEREVEDVNRELEQMEKNLVEANQKISRLTVQQESCQGEIAFLREEQDGDKIKIGDLEAALNNTEESLSDERDRIAELEQRLSSERHQREVIASREKEEVQQTFNELNREASAAKDEARKLRKSLTSNQVESAEWKQKLFELESNLREALGDLSGTRSSLLGSIAKLQRELENNTRDLNATKASLAEKERLIKHRDNLLEDHALESRQLADMLDKERQTHRNTRHQFETFQKTSQHATRTLTQHETRVQELESTKVQDRKKIATLENNLKDQMNERNTLLLTLWNRLSALCGSDWAHNNSLINGRALPSLESVSTMLPGFSKNLIAAVKTIETLMGDFRTRIRLVEKDLWKEYQTLETNLDVRTKRLDRLETMARSAVAGIGLGGKVELIKLRDMNKDLQDEIATLRAASDVQVQFHPDQSPSPSIPTGPRDKPPLSKSSRTSTMTRHSSTTVEQLDRQLNSRAGASRAGAVSRAGSSAGDRTMTGMTGAAVRDDDYRPDLRWQVRLQELEYKLKAEREARLVDRGSARQRLEEKNRENQELAAQLERNRLREDMARNRGEMMGRPGMGSRTESRGRPSEKDFTRD